MPTEEESIPSITNTQELYENIIKWKVPNSLAIYINFTLLDRSLNNWEDPMKFKNKMKAYKTYLKLWLDGKSTKTIDELVKNNNQELIKDLKKSVALKLDHSKKSTEELVVDSFYLLTRHPFVSSIGDLIVEIRSRTNGILKVQAEEWYIKEYLKILSEADKPKEKTKPILFPIP